MKTIRNTKLFTELKIANYYNKDLWTVLFDEHYHCKDGEIPIFFGQLDHIEVKERGIYFYENGSNGRDNSFVIRPISLRTFDFVTQRLGKNCEATKGVF